MSEFKPILPGSPEFVAAMDQLKQTQIKPQSMQITFETVPLSGGAYLEHTIISTAEDASKIVILLRKATHRMMESASAYLYRKVNELNIPGTWAEGEPSSLRSKQYDFVLFDVPVLQVENIRNLLVKELTQMFTHD